VKRILALVLVLATPVMAKPKHFYQDKKWWIGEAAIVASGLASGISVNHTRQGGTNLFGNATSSGEIAGIELAGFGVYTGLHILDWKVGHDDPNKVWRFIAYTSVPAIATSFNIATAVDALNSTPAAKPDLSKIEIVTKK